MPNSILGVVRHVNGDNILSNPERLKAYSPSPPVCQHCGVTTARGDSYIIQRGGSSPLLVGRACVLNYVSEDEVVRASVGFTKRQEADPENYLAAKVLDATFLAIDRAGWKGRTTTDEVRYILDHPPELPVHHSRSNDFIIWVRSVLGSRPESEVNSYLGSVYTLFNSGFVPKRHLNLAVSGVGVYLEELAARENRAVAPVRESVSKFVGTEGDRGHRMDVLVKKITELEPGEYGRRFLCIMVTQPLDGYAGGDVVKWFTGEGLGYEEGDIRHIKATIKEHTVYNGENETIIQRAYEVDPATGKKLAKPKSTGEES